jgi:hypothetical protein
MKPQKTVVPPDDLPRYGFPKFSNRHRKRLEAAGVLPARVALTYHRHGYIEDELIEKAQMVIEKAIAKRDAKLNRREQPIVEESATA